jgi:hypothetical protein
LGYRIRRFKVQDSKLQGSRLKAMQMEGKKGMLKKCEAYSN